MQTGRFPSETFASPPDGARDTAPLVFVYIGNPLPSYAKASIALAQKSFVGSIHLLTDEPQSVPETGIHVHDIRQWYDPEQFQAFERASQLDPLFRGGFWLKTAERFFVLEQFLTVSGFTRMFHGELDVLVLDLDGYSNVLDRHGSGVFAPFDAPERGCASLIYINEAEALRTLCEFTIAHADLGSEMAILGHFLHSRPDIAHALPSDQVFAGELWPLSPSTVPSGHGLVDAMSCGLWVLGQDPRNDQRSTRNHFRTSVNNHPMKNLSFRASLSGRRMWVSPRGDEWLPLRALHVHSKVFGRLRIPGILALYAFLANRRFNTVVTLKPGGLWAVLIAAVLSRQITPLLKKLPQSLQHTLATFLTVPISRSPRLLSERQREIVISLLPQSPTASDDSNKSSSNASEIAHPELWCPGHFDPPISRFPESQRAEIRKACGVFWHALHEAEAPTVYILGERTSFPAPVVIKEHSQLFLWPSREKEYVSTRHTVGFWSQSPIDDHWSFSSSAQIINPTWVREMFPSGSEDLLKWLESGLGRPAGTLNAFQAYGTYVWSIHRQKVVLRKIPLAH